VLVLPAEACCGGSLPSSRGSTAGLYAAGRRGVLGTRLVRGAVCRPGASGGGGFGRCRRDPCVWESASASLWNQILHFVGHLNVEKGCKNRYIICYQVLVLLTIKARELPVFTESYFCGAGKSDALYGMRKNKRL